MITRLQKQKKLTPNDKAKHELIECILKLVNSVESRKTR